MVMRGIETYKRFKIYHFQLGPSKLWTLGSCQDRCPATHSVVGITATVWHLGSMELVSWELCGSRISTFCLSHSAVLYSSFVYILSLGDEPWPHHSCIRGRKHLLDCTFLLWWL